MTDHRKIIEMLYSHIEISSYCYQYDIPVVNILTGELQKKYTGLLRDLTECSRNIVFYYPVYESEIACFAIPFLALIPKRQFDFRLKVMLVCSSNYGLEGYLKKEIVSLSDKIDIICVMNTNDLSLFLMQ